METKAKRIECIIVGRVQMVMYRDFATRKAGAHGLTGMVKNMPDGRVFIVAEGEESALTAFIEKLKSGPILAHVERVDLVWKDATGEFSDFRIVYA